MTARQAAPVRSLLARLLNLHTDERAWRVGADGEVAVASRLARLGDGWRVLHAVPVGARGSDIDHVVIGPGGVFTLNTKSHPGGKIWVAERAFMVNGRHTDYVRNSRHEAARAKRLLSAACGIDVPVEPVIVVLADALTVKAQPHDVHVVARRRIDRWLRARPSRLSAGSVELVYEQARRDVTWRSGTGTASRTASAAPADERPASLGT